jgi:hypothetical protein
MAAGADTEASESETLVATAAWGDQIRDMPEKPPKTGPGSSRDAWVDYADSRGVEITDDMTRDEIINALGGE